MIDTKPNPFYSDMETIKYLKEYGTLIEKSVTFNELRKGFSLFGKIQVPHFLVSKKGKAYTQNYNMNPNKSKGTGHQAKGAQENKPTHHSTSSAETDKKPVQQQPTETSAQDGKSILKRFKDALSAFTFFGRHSWNTGTPFAKWITQLTKEEENAVKSYTGAYYKTINKYMRGQLKDSDFSSSELTKLKSTIQNITSALKKSELPEDVELHRVMEAKDIHLFQDNPDNIYQDLAFLSTSPVKGSFKPVSQKGKPLINITISVPKGKGMGAWVAPLSTFKKELEFLMPPASKFKIHRCECIDGKNWEVDMEWTDVETEEVITKSTDTSNETSEDIRLDKFMWKASDFKILRVKGK